MGRDITQPERVDSSLERWRRMLEDVALLRDVPRIFRDNLLTLSEDLHRRGVIDALERFDMDEMASAAYEHELEEKLCLHGYLIEPGFYKLVRDGVRIGEIRGVRVYFGEDTRDRRPAGYDARIERTDNGLEAITRFMKAVGSIDGKRYMDATGEVYELVETARIIESKETYAIDDPDIYRAMLDAIQCAAEQGDGARHAALTVRASISIFMLCPACNDLFSKREDCAECEGRGFVRETPDRFRWRS